MSGTLSSYEWMELKATGPGFELPATEIEFKVPVSGLEVVPTSTPTANQVGYTIVGTTNAPTPIVLATGVGSVIRSLALTEGTWLLTAICNAEAVNGAIDLSTFLVGFAGLGVVSKNGSELTGTGIVAGDFYGTSLSYVLQTAAPVNIDLDAAAIFTAAPGATFVINNTDDASIRFTATRLS
jgi:hypothetical protein